MDTKQAELRDFLQSYYDTRRARELDLWAAQLSDDDHAVILADLSDSIDWRPIERVLDCGAGTGSALLTLLRVPGLTLSALEPCPSVLELLRAKPELQGIAAKQGFCDHPEDQKKYAPSSFDLIVAKLVANGLFNPVAAFRNWLAWLRPGGVLAIIEGQFKQEDWPDEWRPWLPYLPLAAYESLETIPQLLRDTGWSEVSVKMMERVNQRPTTRAPRYCVMARKP